DTLVTKFDYEIGYSELISLCHALISHNYFTVALAGRISKIHQGEAPMRQLTIAAATIAIAALVSGVPAWADWNPGGPKQQNGQCWKNHTGNDHRFGVWIACPAPAAGPAAKPATRRRV